MTLDYLEDVDYNIGQAERLLHEDSAKALVFAQLATVYAILAHNRAKLAAPSVPAGTPIGPQRQHSGPKSEANRENLGLQQGPNPDVLYYLVSFGTSRGMDMAPQISTLHEAMGAFDGLRNQFELVVLAARLATGQVIELACSAK